MSTSNGLFQKRSKQGEVEDMELSGVSKHVEFPTIKNEVEFLRMILKK